MSSYPRPNIILVTCHDLGRYLGCYGVGTVRTPRLDALAAEGVRVADAFCTAPQCSPARATLFTGRYPHAAGVLGLTHGDFAWDLHPEERHLGQLLREAGYATVLLGVHHESREAERCGMEQVLPPMQGRDITRVALELVDRLRAGERPFYLQIGYHEPHRVQGPGELDYMGFTGGYIEPDDELDVWVPPWLVDEPTAREELAELQGAVHYLDTAVGALLDGLRERGLERETLFIFTTDHGPALPRAKCSLYDPGIGITLLLRYLAGGWVGGRVVAGLVSNVDVLPTLLEALGIPAPPGLHGRSVLPALRGEPLAGRDAIYAEMTYHDYYDPQRCVRTATHKLILNFTTAPAFMDSSQSWRPRTRPVVPRLPPVAFHPLVELYDLAADPYEQQNLAGAPELAEVQAGLLARLRGWMETTGDPLLDGAVTSPAHRRALALLTM